jgi:hypothetical protein
MPKVHIKSCMLRAFIHPSVYVGGGMTGNVKTISGQFKKSELCAEHRLNVRIQVTTIQFSHRSMPQCEASGLAKDRLKGTESGSDHFGP